MGKFLWLVRRDLLVELRSREMVVVLLFFSLLSLLTFNFSLELRTEDLAGVAPGILWVTILFAAIMGMGRSFVRDRERGVLEGLLLTGVDPGLLYLARAVSLILVLLSVEIVTVPLYLAFFRVGAEVLNLIAIVALGTVGFTALGTLLAALASNTRAREAMLPLVLIPMSVPLIIGSVRATGDLLSRASGTPWLGLLLAFDAIFLVVCYWAFEFVVEE
jgi:heme exporter protein B